MHLPTRRSLRRRHRQSQSFDQPPWADVTTRNTTPPDHDSLVVRETRRWSVRTCLACVQPHANQDVFPPAPVCMRNTCRSSASLSSRAFDKTNTEPACDRTNACRSLPVRQTHTLATTSRAGWHAETIRHTQNAQESNPRSCARLLRCNIRRLLVIVAVGLDPP